MDFAPSSSSSSMLSSSGRGSSLFRVVWGLCLVFLSALQYQLVDACSCQFMHPQDHFCHADFVIKAKVKGEAQIVYSKTLLENGKYRRSPYEKKYRITVNKILKETPAFQNVSQRFVHTPIHESLCGISLAPDTKYLLAGHVNGNKAQIGSCSFYHEWSTMPVRMRKGFNFQYEKHCNCSIKVGWRPQISTEGGKKHGHNGGDKEYCQLPMYDDPGSCYAQHAMCKTTEAGLCHWTKPKMWQDCRAKAKKEAWVAGEP